MFRPKYQSVGVGEHGPRDVWTHWVLPCLGLIITTAVVIALLVLNTNGWRSSENAASFVINQRSTIAIAVQIISHVLGWIQVQILCDIIMSSFRASLPFRAYSLDFIRFIHALSRPNIAWRARWLFGVLTFIFAAFSLVPAALWSGALTPIIAEKHVGRTLNIPTFETDSLTNIWNPANTTALKVDNSAVWLDDKGLFTFDLSYSDIRATFMAAAATASNTTHSSHAKLDQTGYRYLNRSYGLGAAAGLIDIPDTQTPLWYNFTEIGFLANVTCMHNASSAFGFEVLLDDTNFVYELFIAKGEVANGVNVEVPRPETFPNGNGSHIPWTQLAPNSRDIFIWGLNYQPNKTSLSLAVDPKADSDPWTFKKFDKVQCDISYQPQNFSVFVNVTARTISAKGDSDVPWPYYADRVLQTFDEPFRRYSADDSFMYGSNLGHSVNLNINQLQQMRNDNSTAIMFEGLEDYIESMVDNALVMLSSTRLMAANETKPVYAVVSLPAVKYGNPKYIYAALAVNIVVLVVFVAEAVRTRAWRHMARLELSDIGSVILSASQGGTAIAERAGESRSEQVGAIRVQLSKTTGIEREALTSQSRRDVPKDFDSQIRLTRLSSHRSGWSHE